MTTIPPSDGQELAKAIESLRRSGIETAVLSSLANVTYASGFEVPVPVGAGAELTYAPWLLVIGPGGTVAIVPKGAVPVVESGAPGLAAIEFDGLDSFNATDPRASYLAGLSAALDAVSSANISVVGIETRSLPLFAAEAIRTMRASARLIESEPALQSARAIKTAREIELLRLASHLSDVAQTTLAELCREDGKSEFEMFTEISGRVFAAAGRDIPLTGELVTGPRTTTVEYPNGPRERTTSPADAALMDLSGRNAGYWFDCTNTHVIGGVSPRPDQLRYARASQDASEAAMAALKPGGKACDSAAAAESAFAKHGLPMEHYAGHQIGVTVNELPRLVPYDNTIIEAGMVFSVEPGAYMGPGGDFGARSEKMVLVTESGPEILSTFEWGI